MGFLIFRKRWAEISPLPGWSQESVEQAKEQLRTGEPRTLFPSVAFGLSCSERSMDLSPFSLPLNALLSGTPDEITTQAEEAKRLGFAHAKVKIGSFSPDEALHLVKDLLRHFILRLDVNRKWTTEEALSFFSHFSKTAFEYIEEPLKNCADLATFTHPFALDESLRDTPSILRRNLPNLKALVIKPTLTGSFETCRKWALFAKHQRLRFVISSAYESGVGIFHLAHFSRELAGLNAPASLDTYRHLSDDLLKTPFEVRDGRLFIPETICPSSTRYFEH